MPDTYRDAIACIQAAQQCAPSVIGWTSAGWIIYDPTTPPANAVPEILCLRLGKLPFALSEEGAEVLASALRTTTRAALAGTLAYEFPDFPASSLPAIPDWLTPSHWHNDACPSWRAAINGGSVSLFVDYPEPAQREFPETPRFVILVARGDHTGEEFGTTDDWDVALRELEAARQVLLDE